MSLDLFLLENKCNITEGHSQQCEKQITLLKNLVKNEKILHVLEVGFNAGHSAEIFLENNKNIFLTSFDLGYHDYTSVGKKYIDLTFPGRHTMVFGDSLLEIPKFQTSTKYDIIFIDGGHAYNVAYNDLVNCKRFSHKNTIIIMDDTHFPITSANHTHDPTLAWTHAIEKKLVFPIANIDYDVNRGMSLGKYL